MFTKELTYEDAEAIQKILELLNSTRNEVTVLELTQKLGLTNEFVNYYLDFVILKINPIVASRLLSNHFVITPREELKNYMQKGGFIPDFTKAQEAKREATYDRALTRKELEVSIANSDKAIKASNRSNTIALWALLVAVLALLYSIFGSKLFPN